MVGKRRGTHNEVKDIIDRRIIKLTGKRRREGDGGWAVNKVRGRNKEGRESYSGERQSGRQGRPKEGSKEKIELTG